MLLPHTALGFLTTEYFLVATGSDYVSNVLRNCVFFIPLPHVGSGPS